MGSLPLGGLSQQRQLIARVSRVGEVSGCRLRRRRPSSVGFFRFGFPQLEAFPRVQTGFSLKLSSQNRGSRIHRVRCTAEPREQVLESSVIEKESDVKPAGESEWSVVPDLWRSCAEKFGDRVALVDPHRDPPVEVTYRKLEQAILDFAEGLRVYGIRPTETVALIADNSHRWLISDQGVMTAGAVNAVRGSRSSTDELLHIIRHSDSVALVVDSPEVYNRLAAGLKADPNTNIKFVIVLWSDDKASKNGGLGGPFRTYSYEDVLKSGQVSRQALAASNNSKLNFPVMRPDDVATIVYTSGTSGNPKGVMLTHANLLHQVRTLTVAVRPTPGQTFLSLLPPWHMYERSAEYFTLAHGIIQVYTSVKNFKDDLVQYPPEYFVAVPLVFDILYSGVQKKLAQGSSVKRTIAQTLLAISLKYMDFKRIWQGRELGHTRKQLNAVSAVSTWLGASILALVLYPLYLLSRKLVFSKIREAITIKVAAISGGGSLAPNVDKFFEAIGIVVLNGYGLTETSPVVSARIIGSNILGSVGRPIPETEIKVVDAETDEEQIPGVRGLVKVRGPQVMKGYYKNAGATKKAIDVDGWFDTGDLGWIAPSSGGLSGGRQCEGVLVLDGRAKDTIVLKTGENIEPAQVEDIALQSPLVQQIVVVGQDQRRLGALIVANKDDPSAANLSQEELKDAIQRELRRLASGMQAAIGVICLVDEAFTVDNGLLTPTLKIKREAVLQRYVGQIDDLFRRHS